MEVDPDRRIDLAAEDRRTVLALLDRHLPGVEAWVYGSRAKRTSRPHSDLDLVLFATPEQRLQVGDLREAFEESNLPFRVDLFVWDDVPDADRRRIEAEHVVLVPATSSPPTVRLAGGERDSEREADALTDGRVPMHNLEGWREVTLRDLIEIRHGFAFDGDFIHDEPPGHILLTPGNFAVGGGFKGSKFKYYSGPVRSDFVLSEGDLLVTMTDLSKTSATLGYPAFAPRAVQGKHYLHNQRLGKVIAKNQEVNTRYLFYVMCGVDYRYEVLAGATGTTVKHTSPDRILCFRFEMPPPSEQRAIAHILGTLDDKIELNRRMNATLEAMARALFRSWFVDFDPVRAKMAGRDTGLPKEIADLFPDRLVDSALGEIPAGWNVGVLDDAVELLNGGTPRTSVARFWNGDIPWYTAKDAPALYDVFAVKTERTITQAGVDNSATSVLPERTTVISARGTVGRLACLGRPMAMNQTCYGIRGADGYGDFFTYWLVRRTVDELRSRTHGTIFDTITRQTFALVELPLTSVRIAGAFESAVTPIMQRILSNLRQSSAIAALRDALLPKLVSGKLRVSVANTPYEETSDD